MVYVIKVDEEERWYNIYSNGEKLYSISKCNSLEKVVEFLSRDNNKVKVIRKEDK